MSLKKHLEFEKSILTVFLGVAKRFGNGKIQPIIRGGGFVMLSFGAEETIQRYNNAPSVTLSGQLYTLRSICRWWYPDANRQTLHPTAC